MAGYPKIWTKIYSEHWFQEADLVTRGVMLQLIILCKQDGDTGHLEHRSWRFLADRLGCHKDTCTKIVANLASINFLTYKCRPTGSIHIYVCKYLKSQRAKSYSELLNPMKKSGVAGQICNKNGHISLTEASRSEAKRIEANTDNALTRTNQKRERTLADVLAEREQKRGDKV